MVIINPERTSRTLRAGWYRDTTYTFRPEPLPPASREAERDGTRGFDDAKYGGARQQPDSSSGEHEPVPPGSEPKVSVLPLPARAGAGSALAEPSFTTDVCRERTQV